MRETKKGIETIFISVIVISFLMFTTITIKNSPEFFCRFLIWLGGCEDDYGKVCKN